MAVKLPFRSASDGKRLAHLGIGKLFVIKYFFLILNILTDLICAPLALYLTRQFYRTTVIHPSLKLIYVVHFCTFQLYAAVSIVCLLYQGNILITPETYPEDLLINFAGSYKMGYMWSALFFTLLIIIERLVATIKMKIYEKSQNIALGVVLCCVEQLASGYCTWLSVTKSFGTFDGIFILFFLVIPVLLIFAVIYHFNNLQLARVSSPFTLSEKYQIIENLHVFKALHYIVGLSGFNLFITTLLIIATRTIDLTGRNDLLQIFICFFLELFLSIVPVLTMWQLNRNELFRKSVREKIMARQQEGGEYYFKDLRESWK
ncbi:unnamed protein product [Caenorhabditis auriculariae]|uniref:Uncharacterized protein n=1 Tax=Caenorhabditis auriculariae TaxID=2777116 RepID=A0A8S1GSL1_9PELO|nr:unnamed protein product [Caenorhabditis auriculariae]